jgi:F1F0 ATPase subunit 2
MGMHGAIELALYFAAGAVLGAAYFALLHWTVRLLTSQTASMPVIALYLLRFAAAALVFWIIAQHGAAPLLSALLGFLVARMAGRRLVRTD